MAKAFVLINTDMGAEMDVINTLKQIPYVKEVYSIYGVYDVIAKIEADTMDKVKETISFHVRRLDHVKSTLTMIVMEP